VKERGTPAAAQAPTPAPGRAVGTPWGMPSAALERVVVTSTAHKPSAHGPARRIAERFAAAGIDVVLDLAGERPLGDLRPAPDLVVAVGGDGTLLATARRLLGQPWPVLGVNLGKLGFLAAFGVEEALAYAHGVDPVGWRAVAAASLSVSVRGGPPVVAFNDATVSQGVMTRLVRVRLDVDGFLAAEYRADGVVISTPVGSTAYSLSLGGPILLHELRALLVTPVAPQALANRPIVLGAGARLRLTLEGRADEIAVVLDGQERIDLASGDAFDVTLGPDVVRLVPAGYDPFAVLRRKLRWTEGPNLDGGPDHDGLATDAVQDGPES
jgi:NAD+ kinase